MKLKHILILQNKVDLIKESAAVEHHASILEFIQGFIPREYKLIFIGTIADGAPIIPISAQLKFNIDAINEYICTRIPVPVRDFSCAPRYESKEIIIYSIIIIILLLNNNNITQLIQQKV